MVLEALIGPVQAEQHPWRMIGYGFLFNTVAIILSLWIFGEQASLIMVFLTVMASMPLVYSALKREEGKAEVITKEIFLLKEHGKALTFLMFLFLGIMLSTALWYLLLPEATVTNLFGSQSDTILTINSRVTQGGQTLQLFLRIFFNNFNVTIFCLLFAFVYGLGAIFILTWNATVIGVAIGNYIRSNISSVAATMGLDQLAHYFKVISYGFLQYAIHGIPEILAYFAVGLAGGIISLAVIRHHNNSKEFERVLIDSSDLILLSVALLFVAAILEVFVTPLFF